MTEQRILKSGGLIGDDLSGVGWGSADDGIAMKKAGSSELVEEDFLWRPYMLQDGIGNRY
jgi:hypothetical protein